MKASRLPDSQEVAPLDWRVKQLLLVTECSVIPSIVNCQKLISVSSVYYYQTSRPIVCKQTIAYSTEDATGRYANLHVTATECDLNTV